MPTVKNVGEPCAGEPQARFEVAAGGNQASRQRRAAQAPPADPTATDVIAGLFLLVRTDSELFGENVCDPGEGPAQNTSPVMTARGFWDDGERRMNANARVGMLGVGLMGSAMAHRLLDRGIAVIEWDRDAEALRALEARGGESAEGPGAVVSGAGVVITMLPTAAIVLDVVEPTLGDWPEDTVWLQMSSVGAAEADQLSRVAESHGVRLVDAPVSGS